MSEMNILYLHISDLCKQSVPKRIGAYVITHTFDNVHVEKYVGSTKNLYNRMNKHNEKKIICINLYITDDMELAESLERILMELINPATNSLILPLSDNDKEVMNELLRDTDIKEHDSHNIVKVGCRYLKYINRNERRLVKRTKRLNVELDDKYLDVINIFKVSNKYEIEQRFGISNQQTALQYIILEYMKLKNKNQYVEMIEDNKSSSTSQV